MPDVLTSYEGTQVHANLRPLLASAYLALTEQLPVRGASTANTIGFTGREHDGTSLYFYRARYYAPRLQRFVSEDPSASVPVTSIFTRT
jgi:RHS repeat-associated protein